MLTKVRRDWIDGYLKHSLDNLARLELGLEENPDAVSRPWELIVQQPDRAPRPLPPGQAMGDIFDELGQALLILGAPGAGKTTLLLELARDLLDRAERDASYPMPVVFHLSSWAVRRRPLGDWLVDELAERYYVPRKLARAWTDAEQVLPLLDGLDEVAPEHRAECVEAINAFRRQHGQVPLAVCCRAADYQALSTRVELSGAVAIEPLSRAQVSTYLKQAGKPLAGVRTALRDDETLWELLETPLMLSIVTLAYQGRSAAEVRATGSLEERRAHLFAKYTDRMFERRTKVTEYTREQTIHWLTWLAQSLMYANLSVFYLEWMQPNWLTSRAQQRTVDMMGIMLVMLTGLILGLTVGFVSGLGYALSSGLADEWLAEKVIVVSAGVGLVYGLAYGLASGLVAGLVDHTYGHRIVPAETLRWSLAAAKSRAISKLVRGLAGGLGIGLVGGLILGLADELVAGVVAGLGAGLLLGLIGGLIYWLTGGIITGQISTRMMPNEGMRRSLGSARISFVAVGLVGGLGAGLLDGIAVWVTKLLVLGMASGLISEVSTGLVRGLIAGPLFGLVAGLTKGGYAYAKHYTLRFVLWHNDYAPWNYIRFLDYAAERIFLLKVGGGYIFTHRLLMEYFASLEPTKQVGQGRAAVEVKPTEAGPVA
jgi:hypothetical protein